MRVGIDLGTTRTVVATADRGNYPIVTFEGDDGSVRDWFPAYIAASRDDVVFGFAAEAKIGDPAWTVIRGIKRELAVSAPETEIAIGARSVAVGDLLVGYLRALLHDIRERSNLVLPEGETVDAMISVPANANSNQRFLTMEAFRAAGYHVLGLLNEPSAAGVEFVHRHGRKALGRGSETVAVYDLGGGTFDVSVIRIRDEHDYDVVASEGIGRLGGDDFDQALLALALEAAGLGEPEDANARSGLLAECRERKEGLHANSRKISIDLARGFEDAGDAIVRVKDFEKRIEPHVAQTLDAMDTAIDRAGEAVGAVYLVGGATGLPLVARAVKKRHGRKVRRSPYPFAATAVGLAITADQAEPIAVHERFTRHFGVWREAEAGRRIVFDSIFEKDTPLPAPGAEPLRHRRRYRAAHDIGHYRYLECSEIDHADAPAGDVSAWDEVRFPIDPALSGADDLDVRAVARMPDPLGLVIEEEYACDATGAIEVTIRNASAGYERVFRLRQ